MILLGIMSTFDVIQTILLSINKQKEVFSLVVVTMILQLSYYSDLFLTMDLGKSVLLQTKKNLFGQMLSLKTSVLLVTEAFTIDIFILIYSGMDNKSVWEPICASIGILINFFIFWPLLLPIFREESQELQNLKSEVFLNGDLSMNSKRLAQRVKEQIDLIVRMDQADKSDKYQPVVNGSDKFKELLKHTRTSNFMDID